MMGKRGGTAVPQTLLDIFWAHSGLEEALAVLSEFLQQHVPFEALSCYVTDQEQNILYPLVVYKNAVVDAGAAASFRLLPPRTWVEAHTVDASGDFLLDNSLDEEERRTMGQFFDQRQSVIIMRLFSHEARCVSFAFTSEAPDRFDGEHIRILRTLRPLLIRLARKFFDSAVRGTLALPLRTADAGASPLGLLRRCPGLKPQVARLEGVASTGCSLVIRGESGVGKDLFANALHMLSTRSRESFVSINCAALTESLLDDELFGHEQGAFTGAVKIRRGIFEQAHLGTLFLDEVGELSPQAQAKLLRVLETGELTRIGGERRLFVDVRVVAATNRNMEDMLARGVFREDLWYRLSMYAITVPPLRSRPEDIAVLAEGFYRQGLRLLPHPPVPALTPGYLASLLPQPWPGNARQLRHVIEQSIIEAGVTGAAELLPLAPPDGGEAAGVGTAGDSFSLDAGMARHITMALERCQWRVSGPFGAAKLLGINANTLRSRMKKLGLAKPAG